MHGPRSGARLRPAAAGLPAVTLNQLEIFSAVVRCGSFSRAAEVLARSQAAISQQMKLLEAALGTRLLERVPGRPIRVTETGRVVLSACENVLQELNRAVDELESVKRIQIGEVKVGSGTYFGSYFLPTISASFQKKFPSIAVHVGVSQGADSLTRLQRGDFDVVVTGDERALVGLAHAAVAENSVVWIARPDHPLSTRRQIPFENIAAESLVLPPLTSSIRRRLEIWAGSNGWTLAPRLEVTGIEAQVNSVLNGLGITLVPAHSLSRYVGAIHVLSVEGFPLRSNWWVVWREDDISAAAEAFREHLLQQRETIEQASVFSELTPA